ncbi:MAG: c-type cytochrome domain-containing protein, partial [Bacteroidota bacterium]
MAYSLKSKWTDYAILGLTVFLIFCLVFESFMQLPMGIAWMGKWHPLLLHFPIVLLLIAVFLGLSGKSVPWNLLVAAVISALLTAISGFFLGKGSAQGELLFWHKWLGSTLALLAVFWYGVLRSGGKLIRISKGVQVTMVALIVFTGHYGGMVTHGEDFLALPTDRKLKEIPENPLIYAHIVQPILDDRCVQCHNPNKQKGGLLMTDLKGLLMGGENGNTVVPGQPDASEMIRRLHLPLEDEEHMPPEGDPSLEGDEIQILERWVALGASDTLRLDQVLPSDPLAQLIKARMAPDPMEKWEDLPAVADSTLVRLSSDYLTLTRMAGITNALKVNAYMPPEYDSRMVLDLIPIQGNIVELDLSGLPLGARELGFAANCPNLEWLEIDHTPISDVEMDTLGQLKKIRLLKVFETGIGDESLKLLTNWGDLKRLFIWNTKVSPRAMEEFTLKRPQVLIEMGI